MPTTFPQELPDTSIPGDYRIEPVTVSARGRNTQNPATRNAKRSGAAFSPDTSIPGDYRIRTGDPLLAKQVLYQLS